LQRRSVDRENQQLTVSKDYLVPLANKRRNGNTKGH